MWDIDKGEAVHVLNGHAASVRAIDVCGNRAVSASYDMTCRVRPSSFSLGILLHSRERKKALTLSLSLYVRVRSRLCFFCSQLWNVDTGECLHVLRGHTSKIYSVAFDGQRVVTGSLDSTVRVWSAENG